MTCKNHTRLLGALLAVVVSVIGHAEYHDMAKLEQAAQKCRQGTSVTAEWLTGLYAGKVTMEPDQTTKCYFKCLLQEFDMLDADNKIKLDNHHGHFYMCQEKSKEHKEDVCDMAYNFDKCIHMQHPDLPVV